MKQRFLTGACAALIAVAACSNGVPLGPSSPNTTGSSGSSGSTSTTVPTTSAPTPTPTTPTTPTAPSTTAVAYTQDIAPILNSDCLPCHNDRSPAGRYSVSSYSAVMRAVVPGSSSSALVIVTRPGGLMYGFLSGDRTSKSSLISQWVLAGAPQSR